MAASIRVGLVGYGYWGPNLARNIHVSSQLELVVIVDSSLDRLRVAKNVYPSIQTTQDFRDVVLDEIDAVVVATPASSHYLISAHFLSAQKHVLVTKPLTNQFSQAIDLVELADSVGSVLMVDHTFLFTEAVSLIKNRIDSGSLGELVYFESTRVNLGLFQPDVSVLWDLAVHDLAILNYITGLTPRSVSATAGRHKASEHAAVSSLSLAFESEFFAQISVSWLSPVKLRRTLISGTSQSIVFDDMAVDERVKIYDSQIDRVTSEEGAGALMSYRLGDIHIPRLRSVEALSSELEHFASCIRTNSEPISSGKRSVGIVATLEAAEKSIARGGAPVMVFSNE